MMEILTVNLKELIEHCNEWKDECEEVVVIVDQEEMTLEINGSMDGGMIMSDLYPIKGIEI